MFSSIVKEHRRQHAQQKKDIDVLKQEATASVEAVASVLLDSVNTGVSNVYENQQKLEQEARTLGAQTARFAKQTNRWLAMYHGLNEALKELGDVRNWAQSIETDMNFIAANLENVVDAHAGKAPAGSASSSSGTTKGGDTESKSKT